MSTPINIFIIYAREDIDIKQRLLLHLNPFRNAFNAVIWHDGNIEAGQQWKPHIESRLDQTDIFILLVSIDFMNSEFINQVEFKYAIERHRANKSTIIPVIINYCQWDIDISFKEFTFNLKELQVLPNEGKPIGDWKTPEQAFNNIAAGIRTVLSSIKSMREQEQQEKERLEEEIARNKIEEQRKQDILKEKEKAKDEQVIAGYKRAETENAESVKNYHEAEETKNEGEDQTIEIIDQPSFFSLHKKKILIWGALSVIVLSIFLLIISLGSFKETAYSSELSASTTVASATTTDSSSLPATDQTDNKQEDTKTISDPKEEKKSDPPKIVPDGQQQSKIEDEQIFQKVETEASFPGGHEEWKRYLEKNLDVNVPFHNGAPNATYTVMIQFIVDTEGNISDVKPVSSIGYGMEEEAIRVIKKGPKWVPAIQNGRYVKSYRKQSVHFLGASK